MSNIKYSILIPYYNRPSLRKTLQSYVDLYGDRDDFEVIICESYYNFEDEKKFNELTDIYISFCEKLNVDLINSKIPTHSCCVCYNLAADKAKGEYLVLTNPESPHTNDILSGIDSEISIGVDKYIVCACKNVEGDGSFKMWYQHSHFNPRQLHFCSCISKKDYNWIGGFSDEFQYGIAYEDDDFLEKIKVVGLKIVERDDLIADHIDHDRSYGNAEMVEQNRLLYNSKWNRNR